MEDQPVNFFKHPTYLLSQGMESIQIVSRERYGSKVYVSYIGCYNRAVRDIENPSISDTENLEMHVLEIDILGHGIPSSRHQIHPNFLLVADIT